MKTKFSILVGLILISTLLVWWVKQTKLPPDPQIADEPSPQRVRSPLNESPPASALPRSQERQKPTNNLGQPMSAADLEAYGQTAITEQKARNREFERNFKAQLSAPINFYGKVLDENDLPVAAASVNFSWSDLPPEKETAQYTGDTFTPFAYMHSSETQTTSDAHGLFSLLDRKGKRLSVTVTKEGYYSASTARQSFEFGDPLIGIFAPDPFNPVVFRLRKRGPGTDLITSAYGVTKYFGIKMPLDGAPIQVDMLERKIGQGPLAVNQIKPAVENLNEANEWTFRMHLADGGFIEHNDEFPFEAPETGYKAVVEFRFQSGETNWLRDLSKDYYIKFGTPPTYGRLHLETSIRMSGARLTYAINPGGSRNLEPK